ncbi:putative endonuclease-reverse transcriptase [Trichonephila clavipes]|nr:putative endonuclease-reverse transcriptase [Trichonephila clavipes]
MICFEDLFKNVEYLRRSKKSRAFFREVNGIKEFKRRTTSCRNREGTILSGKTKVLRRWQEHFDNLLNCDNGDYEALTVCMETQSQGLVEPSSLEEVIEAT